VPHFKPGKELRERVDFSKKDDSKEWPLFWMPHSEHCGSLEESLFSYF
jgi:hypothetical protein